MAQTRFAYRQVADVQSPAPNRQHLWPGSVASPWPAVHKIAIHAGFTCPNRDGSKGRGGCTFCNNVSFSPNARREPAVGEQIAAGRAVIARRTGARRFIAYFQAYTNTYADVTIWTGCMARRWPSRT